MRFASWVGFLVLAACARVAVRQDGTASGRPCPSLSEHTQWIDRVGATTLQQACRAGDRCEDGPFVCRCEAPQGGAPRPSWWECHRARSKADGCPDDEVLLAGAACVSESKQCRVPRTCGCAYFMDAVCTSGRWVIPECTGPCLAP